MRVAFWHSDKPREIALAKAFSRGIRTRGDIGIIVSTSERHSPPVADVSCMVGVKSLELWRDLRARGQQTIYFDKGYDRRKRGGVWSYWRVAVNSHHPTEYLESGVATSERWEVNSKLLLPWRENGKHILIAGSSAKYHRFYGLPDPTTYNMAVVEQLRRWTDREIVYRPKPSWHDAVPIRGTRYSRPTNRLVLELQNAHCLITHGSNACWEAALAGIPSIILGNGIVRSISSTSLDAVEDLKLATMQERIKLMWGLANCQFTLSEMMDGEAWRIIRPQLI